MKKKIKLLSLGLLSLSLALATFGCGKKKDNVTTKENDTKATEKDNTTKENKTTKENVTTQEETYTIKFVNEDNLELSTQTLKKGEMPVYSETPTYSDEVFTYEFSGWDSEIVVANGDKTYKATYNKTYIEYKVIFYDWDDSIIGEDTYHKDGLITLPIFPERDADDVYTYTSNGWDFKEDENKVMHVKPVYNSHYINYRIKFFDYNDELIKEATYHGDEGYLSTIPANPTRSADETYTYSFSAWEYSNGLDDNGAFLKVKAKYKETYIDYTVTFLNNTQEVSTRTYHYGETIVYPDAPTRKADKLCTYEFLYWDYNPTTCTENLVIYACFESHYIDYTITFINYNGNVISTKTNYHYNDVITKPDNPSKDYCAFLGWSLSSTGSVVNVDERVEGNKTYYAIFDKAKYRYRFVNYDGIIVSETTDYVGSQIVPPANNPTRESTVSTVYTFDGWYTNMTGGIKVTEFGTLSKVEYYYARYTEETRKYTITWKMDNGDVIGTDLVEYGKTPACSYGTPTKTPDAQYSYVFTGWTPAISSVTGDYSYKAVFDKEIRTYTITWKNGNTTIYSEDYAYGKTPTYSGSTPTKSEDAQYTYTFSGWSPTISTVVGNQTYTAQYSTTTKTYTYYFYDEECVSAVTYTGAYGTQATKPATPTKAADADYTYTFDGWYELTTHVKVTDFTITGNKYLYPKFTSTNREYTITFRKTSGSIYTTITKPWGSTITAPKDPTRDGYKFIGWDRTIPSTMPKNDLIITANWEVIKYEVTIVNNMGSSVTVSGLLSIGTNQAVPGTQYTVTVNAPKAYTIKFIVDGVEKNTSNNEYTFDMPARNMTITISGKAYSHNNGYTNKILFGEYPQTLVTKSATKASLNSLIKNNPTSSDANGWTVYKYYNLNMQTNYMWYKDVTLNGEKYRAVYITAYRPDMYGGAATKSESYVDNNGYETEIRYWFKYEPIAWTISKTDSNGKSLLIADLVIDGQVFNNSTSPDKYAHNGTAVTAPNSYLYSDIRQFLINDFYNTAFDSLSKSIMSDRVFTGTTNDKIGLVTTSDIDGAVGILAKATDYAQIQGVEVTSSGYTSWYLSTTGKKSGTDITRDVQFVTTSGTVNEQHNYYLRGVRPAIYMTIE